MAVDAVEHDPGCSVKLNLHSTYGVYLLVVQWVDQDLRRLGKSSDTPTELALALARFYAGLLDDYT